MPKATPPTSPRHPVPPPPGAARSLVQPPVEGEGKPLPDRHDPAAPLPVVLHQVGQIHARVGYLGGPRETEAEAHAEIPAGPLALSVVPGASIVHEPGESDRRQIDEGIG